MSIKCPNCSAQIELRVVSAETRSNVKPAKNMDSVGDLLHGIDLDSLNDYEREFVVKTRERYEQYHDTIKMSDKQLGLLRKIAAKVF